MKGRIGTEVGKLPIAGAVRRGINALEPLRPPRSAAVALYRRHDRTGRPLTLAACTRSIWNVKPCCVDGGVVGASAKPESQSGLSAPGMPCYWRRCAPWALFSVSLRTPFGAQNLGIVGAYAALADLWGNAISGAW